MDLFDAAEGRRLKESGLAITASYPNDCWLDKARYVAKLLAARNGETDIDQVLQKCPRPPDVNPNAAGNIFSGKEWTRVGYKQSSKVSRRAGVIGIWKLRDNSN